MAGARLNICYVTRHGLVWFGDIYQYWKERNCSWPPSISICTAISPKIWYGAFSFHRQLYSGANPEIIIIAGADLTVRHQQILNYWSAQLKNMPLEISWRWKWEIQKVEMRNTSRKSWENEMRIGRVTKWGLGGWHKCPARAELDECGNSVLVSGQAKIRTRSISTHSALSIAKWLY